VFVATSVVGRVGAEEKKAGGAGVGAGDKAGAKAAKVVGAWEYAEDRTAPEHHRDPRERPPLGAVFKVALDGTTYVVTHVRKGAEIESRVPADGKEDVETNATATRTTWGSLESGVLTLKERYVIDRDGKSSTTEMAYTLTPCEEGLLVRMQFFTPTPLERTALYRATADIPAPTPAKADLSSLSWLEGRFFVSGKSTGGKQRDMEEHWGPAGGGAMLGTARTVADGRMTSFEYLRIVERNGSLVYVAQPGGGAATEFVLTELTATRALFENPRHDYPKRIVYERLPAAKGGQDGLRTEISDAAGARPHAASYTRVRPKPSSDK
jgi:hypothetical protein